jgi:methylglyoxal synthase
MKVKITYLPTPNEVNELDLMVATTPKGECIIGRSPDCDLPLESPDVSRIHGKFFVQGSNYYYCDTGSRNGSIINKKLAEKNQPYVLKHGDSIQIGDYILTMEGITPKAEQLPETVFRVIDPALFSRPISENINVANIANQESEVVSQTPSATFDAVSLPDEEIIAASDSSIAEEIENIATKSPEIEADTAVTESDESADLVTPISEERTFVQPSDIISAPPEIKADTAVTESDESADLVTPISEERTFVQPSDIISAPPEIESDAAVTESDESVDLVNPIEETFVQPRDMVEQPSSSVDDLSVSSSDEDVDLAAPILQEFTTVQPRDLVINLPLTNSDEDVDLAAPILQEFTTVQPRDIPLPTYLTDRNEDVDLQTSDDIETSDAVNEVSSEVTEETASEVNDAVSQAPEDAATTEEVLELDESQAEDLIEPEEELREVSEVASHDNSDLSSVGLEEVSEEPTTTEDVLTAETEEIEQSLSTEATTEEEPLTEDVWTAETLVIEESISTEATSEEEPATDVVLTAETLVIEESISTEATSEEEPATDVVLTAEAVVIEESISTEELNDVLEVVNQTPEEVAEAEELLAVDNVEADTGSELSQMQIQKNIVLIAHESKKSELAELVAQHKEFFSEALTVSWPSVSEVLNQQAGITVSEEIPSPTSGGYQKINLLLNSGDVLAVIFLRDFLSPQPGQANEEALLRICNINQVLVATNLKTAEAIVHYLKHISE